MSFIKATALFLSLAVFNPLCCCLPLFADGSAALDVAPSQNAHSCCVAEAAEESTNDLPSQESESCPHSIDRDSQISQQADHPDLHAKGLSCPTFLETGLAPLPPTASKMTRSTYGDPLLTAKSLPASQAYCVRLL